MSDDTKPARVILEIICDVTFGLTLFLAGASVADIATKWLEIVLPHGVAYSIAFGVCLLPFLLFAKFRGVSSLNRYDYLAMLTFVVALAVLHDCFPNIRQNRPLDLAITIAFMGLLFTIYSCVRGRLKSARAEQGE